MLLFYQFLCASYFLSVPLFYSFLWACITVSALSSLFLACLCFILNMPSLPSACLIFSSIFSLFNLSKSFFFQFCSLLSQFYLSSFRQFSPSIFTLLLYFLISSFFCHYYPLPILSLPFSPLFLPSLPLLRPLFVSSRAKKLNEDSGFLFQHLRLLPQLFISRRQVAGQDQP